MEMSLLMGHFRKPTDAQKKLPAHLRLDPWRKENPYYQTSALDQKTLNKYFASSAMVTIGR
jgi:hypothetical protein